MTSENPFMIKDIVTYSCPKCGSLDMVKNGRITKVRRNITARPVIVMAH